MNESDRGIELFCLKNAVITNSMRQMLRDQGNIIHKTELEKITDLLVQSHISQVEEKIRNEARRMSEFYEIFYILENDIRSFVEDIMRDAAGADWWLLKVPPSVQDTAKKNVDREANEGLPPRSSRMIDYINFGELGDIISQNWIIFDGVFSSAAKNRVIRFINRLNLARNAIAHCTLLAETEVVRLKILVSDWYKLME
jgi:hypothetical protein